MKKYCYVLLFIHVSNAVAMQAYSLEKYRRRAGIATTNHGIPVLSKTVPTQINKQSANQLIMGYVFVPVSTFVAAAAVFNAYKDL